MLKRWRMLPSPPIGFARGLGLPSLEAHLLYNRGIRDRAGAEIYLAADARLSHDPTLLPDMGKAVARLKKAMECSEVVGVFGDFDADGITGTALLAKAFGDLGLSVVTYLPDRNDEGHGLNDSAVRHLGEQGVTLLLTVDCGATSVDEVALAATLGIDTIVTDHHTFQADAPDAHAIISARRPGSEYPYDGLTGVGTAFKLAEALYATLGRPRPYHLLDLVALGTVADVGPLTGENRFLVKEGLKHLNATKSPGIKALVDSAGLALGSLDTESLSFGLIPRLNGPGRLGHAGVSLELLTTNSAESAAALAESLERSNTERRMLTAQAIQEAKRQLQDGTNAPSSQRVLLVQDATWVPGILGLIAAQLAEQYRRPAIAVTKGEELSRASARSVPGFDIEEALGRRSDLFTRFGGHPQAAGFTIPTSSLPALQSHLDSLDVSGFEPAESGPTIDIDCEVSPALFEGPGLQWVHSLEPFGKDNPRPVFLTRGVRVVESRPVGAEGRHLKMRLWHGGHTFDAIAFRQGEKLDDARDRIDVVYTVGIDEWNGRSRLQLNVQDLRPAAGGLNQASNE